MHMDVSLLLGNIRIRISGDRPERFLNACARNRIRFYSVRKYADNTMELHISRLNMKRGIKIASELGLALETLSEKGASVFIKRIKKRYVLYFMPLLSVLAALYLSFFIWDIEIIGNKTVTNGEILAALEKAGVGIGTFGPGLEQELIRNAVLCEINELSWLTVNVYGSKAEVIVRERREKPELIDEKMPTEVLAKKGGIITKMNVFAGKAEVKVGDTVIPGELLVSGRLESRVSGNRQVHAMAEIYARTWYELSVSMPLEYITKSYTGKNVERKSVVLGNIRLNFYFNAGNPGGDCDKIIKEEGVEIAGFVLPLRLVTSEYREYEPVTCSLSVEEAEAILTERLLSELGDIIKDAELISTSFETTESGGVVAVTLTAECLEQIGVISELN